MKILVRQGGASAAQPDLANLAEPREGIPIFDESSTPLVSLGQRWEQGQAASGQFMYVDVDATLTYRFPPHAEVKIKPYDDDFILAWGRIEGGNDVGRRTPTGIGGDEVIHDVIQLMDCNTDIRGLPFKNGWSRPAETTWQRLNALEAAKLNGSSSTELVRRATTDITVQNFANGHLVDGSDPVDMEAADYPAGTMVEDVMQDIFDTWGRGWGVTIHHVAGVSHKCLLVLDYDDVTTFMSDLRISDQVDDWDPDDPSAPTLAPHWKRSAGKLSDNSQVVSGLISLWGGTPDKPRHLYVETGDPEDEWETWVDVFNDDRARNADRAEQHANHQLFLRQRATITHQPSILLNPDQLHLITAGQSIDVKSVVINQGSDKHNFVTRRIAQIDWEPSSDGRWWAHLSLERPRGAGVRAGGVQPRSTTPKHPPFCTPDPGDTEMIDWDWEPCASVDWEDSLTALTGNAWGTYPGWTGSPGCATGANRSYSRHWDVTEGDVITVTIVSARYGGAGLPHDPGTLGLRFKNAAGAVLEDQGRTIQIGGLSLEGGSHGEFATTVVTFDAAPAGAAHAQLVQATWSTFAVQHVTATVASAPPDNDDFCVPEGSYDPDDPYDAPSTHNHDDNYAALEHTHTPTSLFTSWKAPVRVATTANGTMASAFDAGSTVDGVTLAAGDRILLKDQTDASENGIYLVQASGAPLRDYDMDDSGDFIAGAMVRVMEGTANADKVFGVTTDDPIVLDTDDIDWAEMAGGGGSGSVATDTIWDAKGDLAAGTGADTAAKLTVGSNDTILMADSGQSTGLKWVASQTPSTQALGDSAAEGTADAYARGDHKHGMPSSIDADDVDVADAGAYFSATDVEGVLQEIGAAGPFGEGGIGTFQESPQVSLINQNFTSGTNTITATMPSAPADGDLLLLVCGSSGRAPNSGPTQTNVTWTQRYTGNGNSQHLTIWTGVAAASAGTVITVGFSGNNQQQLGVFRYTNHAAITSASSVATATAGSGGTRLVEYTGALTLGGWYIFAAVGPSGTGPIIGNQPFTNLGGLGQLADVIFAANVQTALFTSSVSSAAWFAAIVALT